MKTRQSNKYDNTARLIGVLRPRLKGYFRVVSRQPHVRLAGLQHPVLVPETV